MSTGITPWDSAYGKGATSFAFSNWSVANIALPNGGRNRWNGLNLHPTRLLSEPSVIHIINSVFPISKNPAAKLPQSTSQHLPCVYIFAELFLFQYSRCSAHRRQCLHGSVSRLHGDNPHGGGDSFKSKYVG